MEEKGSFEKIAPDIGNIYLPYIYIYIYIRAEG
jgi:hypothetical protein